MLTVLYGSGWSLIGPHVELVSMVEAFRCAPHPTVHIINYPKIKVSNPWSYKATFRS